MKKAKVTKETFMREYVQNCSEEHSLEQKLYEDLSITVKDEGFAQYCFYTAIEAQNGRYDSLEDIQADLDSTRQEY